MQASLCEVQKEPLFSEVEQATTQLLCSTEAGSEKGARLRNNGWAVIDESYHRRMRRTDVLVA